MMRNHTDKLIFGIALIVGAMMTVIASTGCLQAQAQDMPRETPAAAEQAAIRIGIYDAEAAFETHPAHKELQEATDRIQAQMQRAQEGGDQPRLLELQQEYKQKQEEAIARFQADVVKGLPVAAQVAGVEVVALQVLYTTDDVEVEDITSHLIGVLNVVTAEKPEGTPTPGLSPQQRQ